jgi:hypothetical protein
MAPSYKYGGVEGNLQHIRRGQRASHNLRELQQPSDILKYYNDAEEDRTKYLPRGVPPCHKGLLLQVLHVAMAPVDIRVIK